MTHTIDHRILIPASPEVIWNTISDLTRNPRWQVDCRDISFLTSLRQGQGTRWRYANERGREFVAEITAWYNTLGYEYRIVDGAPFKHNLGRIRLQEIAEGTIVQWTFNYELRGVLSGVRTIGSPRAVENSMVDSLWTLWKHITETADAEAHEARSLMRDAPDVEQRANYVARHQGGYSPVVATVSQADMPAADQPITLEEPPISDDDTRPRPVVAPQPIAVEQPDSPSAPLNDEKEMATNIAEPDFLRSVREEDLDADTSPGLTAQQPAAAASPVDKPIETPEIQIDASPEAPEAEVASPPEEPAPIATSEGETEEKPANPMEESAPPPVTSESSWTLERLPDEETVSPVLPADDTGTVSVFDLFGVPKPSETQETQAVSEPVAPDEPTTTAPAETPAPNGEIKSDESAAREIPTIPQAVPVNTDLPMPQKTATQESAAIREEAVKDPVVDTADHSIEPVKRIGLRVRLRESLVQIRRPR